MEYENLDASGLDDSYSRPSYVTGGGGGGERLHRKVQKEDGEFKENYVVSIKNI